jgi:hypothetical protein
MSPNAQTRHMRKTAGAAVVRRKKVAASKLNALIQLLKRPKRSSLATLCKATNWQSHSVRATLSRLRARELPVVRLKDEGGVSRYRIS